MQNTKKRPAQLKDLHFEHQVWNNELRFWQDEITLFENRLAEVIIDWTDTHVLAQSEHFQNQYIRHREIIDILLHDIKIHDESLDQSAKDQPIDNEDTSFRNHVIMRGRMYTQRKIYQELKNEFMRFISELF